PKWSFQYNIPPRPFTPEDLAIIRNEVPGILVAPVVSTRQTLIYEGNNHQVEITGTNNEFLDIRNYEIASGRTFNRRELQGGAPVCMLGGSVVEALYARVDPLGTTLRVGSIACRVIGILAPKGTSLDGDDDNIVLMP